MLLAWTLPFLLQGFAIGIDEFYFHRKRGLPLWEKLGHPCDTLSLLLPTLLALCAPWTPAFLATFAALAIISCICVTKDEVLHPALCSVGEHWLHACLFLLHPVVLAATLFLWGARLGIDFGALPLLDSASAIILLGLQGVACGSFLFYQLAYWGFIKRNDENNRDQ